MNVSRVMTALEAWVKAERSELEVRRQMAGHRCEFASPADPEVGDMGVPRCYLTDDLTGDWCQACRARDLLFRELKHRVVVSARAWRRFRRYAFAFVGG